MKSIFNLCLAGIILMALNQAQCREIILLENMASLSEGQMLRKILETKFQLPRSLITLKNIKTECEEKSEAVIHLCLKADGELKVIKMNQFVVKNSFGIFMNQELNGEEND